MKLDWRYRMFGAALLIQGVILAAVVYPMSTAGGAQGEAYVIPAIILELPGSLLSVLLVKLTHRLDWFAYSMFIFPTISYGLLGWYVGRILQRRKDRTIDHVA